MTTQGVGGPGWGALWPGGLRAGGGSCKVGGTLAWGPRGRSQVGGHLGLGAVTIYSDFGAPQNKSLTVSIFSPSIHCEVMGLDTMILVF